MVSGNDNTQESRPPTLEDLVNLCKELNSRKTKYIVIGGMAISQLGFARATEDIDLLVECSKENEKRVIDSVGTLPDHAALELKPGEISQYEVVRVADEIVVDLMKKACGVEYAEASKEIVLVELEEVKIPFASVDLMIKLKQSQRPKDQMDLEFLKHLKKNKSQKL